MGANFAYKSGPTPLSYHHYINTLILPHKIHISHITYCIKVATTVERLDSQSNCLIEQLRILLRRRCNEYVINGFTHDEITEFTK